MLPLGETLPVVVECAAQMLAGRAFDLKHGVGLGKYRQCVAGPVGEFLLRLIPARDERADLHAINERDQPLRHLRSIWAFDLDLETPGPVLPSLILAIAMQRRSRIARHQPGLEIKHFPHLRLPATNQFHEPVEHQAISPLSMAELD